MSNKPQAGDNPVDAIIGQMTAHRDRLHRQAREVDRLIADIAPGESWLDAHSADLKIGAVYVVRRRHAGGGIGQPGLSRWTKNGWRDEYGTPLALRGCGVDVLVPNECVVKSASNAGMF